MLAVLVVLAALVFLALPSARWPYHARSPMTAREQKCYLALKAALPDHVIIFSQVALSRFIGIDEVKDKQRWFARISQMSVDYLLCDDDFAVLCGIELDDKTHQQPHRIQADAKKDKVFATAGIPLIRWQTIPKVASIKAQLQPLLYKPVAQQGHRFDG
jgi:very-short-patch-repair endonuclease